MGFIIYAECLSAQERPALNVYLYPDNPCIRTPPTLHPNSTIENKLIPSVAVPICSEAVRRLACANPEPPEYFSIARGIRKNTHFLLGWKDPIVIRNALVLSTLDTNMSTASNDPTDGELINLFRLTSYFIVASITIVLYDIALTFGQELELIWRRPWSLMSVLYVFVRYIGIPYNIMCIFVTLPTIPVTNTVSNLYIASHSYPNNLLQLRGTFMFYGTTWTSFTINVMLDIIAITRIYVMYQRSRKMLIFLIAFTIAIMVACAVLVALEGVGVSLDEIVLFGNYQCVQVSGGSTSLLGYDWVLGFTWQVLVLGLAIRSAVTHYRQQFGRRTLEGCYAALTTTHVFYFSIFFLLTCFQLVTTLTKWDPGVMSSGVIQVISIVQMFVLGPRLVLGVRAAHANAVSVSGDASAIVFQERSGKSRSSGAA